MLPSKENEVSIINESQNMKLEILLSCMHQENLDIVKKSNINTDVLIINQCNRNNNKELIIGNQRIRMISTTQRGLSNSRNLAIHLSDREFCLLCDDDELFLDGVSDKIVTAFEQIPDADIIIFRMKNVPCRLKRKRYKLGYFACLKVASWQIGFRREAILKSGVLFDPFMGSGSGNGCGEENKFLLDCFRKGLNIYHVPIEIAVLSPKDSNWFHGYNKTFFYQRGTTTRYMLGFLLSVFYALYYVIKKKSLYEKETHPLTALLTMLHGIWNNDIAKLKKK